MTFKQITHPLIGQSFMYMPDGYSPYQPEVKPDPRTVVSPGDLVTIESAWDRPYMAGSKPLFYARSQNTGEATHLVEVDLKKLPSEYCKEVQHAKR